MRSIPILNSKAIALMAFVAVSAPVSAASFDNVSNLTQDQFITLAENLSAATHYRSVKAPEPLGIIGFDLGLEISSTETDSSLFDLASSGSFDGSEIIIPRVHAHKGLPFGIDIGASLASVPEVDATILGAEISYALIEGGAVSPAVGVRASYSQLQGVDEFDLNSAAIELGISKGVLFLTPYAGVGMVRSSVDPVNADGLQSDSFDQRKLVVGAIVNLGFAFTLELDQTGDYRTYTAKGGFRF